MQRSQSDRVRKPNDMLLRASSHLVHRRIHRLKHRLWPSPDDASTRAGGEKPWEKRLEVRPPKRCDRDAAGRSGARRHARIGSKALLRAAGGDVQTAGAFVAARR
eukprot:6137669-Prymnesium_polylepis.1